MQFIKILASVCVGLLATLLAAVSSFQQQFSASESEALLPIDKTTVDVMKLQAPPRMLLLTKKLQTAIRKNPVWWRNHIKKRKPGQPLPYNKKMGLTKEEYREFLGLKMRLKKDSSAKLGVVRTGSRITFNGGKQLPELTGVQLDLKANLVHTPYGVAKPDGRISASKDQKTTGPWKGISWRLEKVKKQKQFDVVIIKFALGRLQSNGRGILYYDARKVAKTARKRTTYILFYDLKAKQ